MRGDDQRDLTRLAFICGTIVIAVFILGVTLSTIFSK